MFSKPPDRTVVPGWQSSFSLSDLTPCLFVFMQVLNEVVVDRGPSSYLSNVDLYLDGRLITSVQGDGETIKRSYFRVTLKPLFFCFFFILLLQFYFKRRMVSENVSICVLQG